MSSSRGGILVTGSHRSGTTWIGRTIAEHPGITYVHEPFNVNYVKGRFHLGLRYWFTHAPTSAELPAIKRTLDGLFARSRLRRAVHFSSPAGFGPKVLVRVAKHLLSGAVNQRVLLKDPIALLSAGWMHERYSLAVICMTRNPLAFVGSLKKRGWNFDFVDLHRQKALMNGWLSPYGAQVESALHRGDFIDRACLIWNILHYVIQTYRSEYPTWLFMPYEEVALNPIREFERIYEYLGLQMDDRIRGYITDYTSSRNPREVGSARYQPRDARQSLDTWKTRLTVEEIHRVRAATIEMYREVYGAAAEL